MENSQLLLTVSDFIALTNQTLEYAYPSINIEGEVSGYKVNQGKYVFFDLKDAGGSVGCFMTVWQLRQPIEDGMKVIISATPKLTQWGKFSLTVRAVRPSGEGSLKKSFDLLREKLDKEGIFSDERKRSLPAIPSHIGVITSTQAAGYADFVKILNDRWRGLRIDVAHVQVQGEVAPDQIIRALKYFNSLTEVPDVIVLVRGGGSADDLSAFNDELLVREIAASRVPTLVGVGHETDTTLADLAADVRAATPSNAAQLVVPDRHDMLHRTDLKVAGITSRTLRIIDQYREGVQERMKTCAAAVTDRHRQYVSELDQRRHLLVELDPRRVLARGYALIRGMLEEGQVVEIEKHDVVARALVDRVETKQSKECI